MTESLSTLPKLPVSESVALLSQIPPTTAFVVGAGLMLTGAYLRWRLPHDRMRAEEQTKDGRLSENQARRRITLLRVGGPLAILVGATLSLTIFVR